MRFRKLAQTFFLSSCSCIVDISGIKTVKTEKFQVPQWSAWFGTCSMPGPSMVFMLLMLVVSDVVSRAFDDRGVWVEVVSRWLTRMMLLGRQHGRVRLVLCAAAR